MSWLEDIQEQLTITTGEGSEFTPEWKNASRLVSYNTNAFEFPNVFGTLVNRRLPKGNQYSAEFYFQGENHLDESERFEIAARDPGAWVISHPFYGRIVVQPTQLTFDNSDLNITLITGVLLETIEENGLDADIAPGDEINQDAEDLRDESAEAFTEIDQQATNDLAEANDETFENLKKEVSVDEDINELTRIYNDANSAVQGAIQNPVQAMRQAQSLLNMPFRIEGNVRSRFNMLERELQNLLNSFPASNSGKRSLENRGAAIVSTMSQAAVDGGYDTRSAVLAITDRLIEGHDDLLVKLDELQGSGYFPLRATMSNLDNLINLTISQLFQIAQDSPQERRVILTEDSNAILLAHKYYGLEADDSTIDRFMRSNEIGLNEILEIKRGREILYFV